eukprot:1394111-Amorphochlora_amoeboformis.AAC.1
MPANLMKKLKKGKSLTANRASGIVGGRAAHASCLRLSGELPRILGSEGIEVGLGLGSGTSCV